MTANDLDRFHIYTLEWDTKEMRIYFDGQLQLSRDFGNDPDPTIFTAPRPLILNVYHVESGGWGYSAEPLDKARLPAHMKVDYVRYYQCPTGTCQRGGTLGVAN